jgi:hypothetical protein
MRECFELAKNLHKRVELHKLQGGVNHENVNLVKTHDEKIDSFQVVNFPYNLDDLATKFLDLNMMNVHALLQIKVFFIREIGKKGPKNDIGQLDLGAILVKSILMLSILTSDLFY